MRTVVRKAQRSGAQTRAARTVSRFRGYKPDTPGAAGVAVVCSCGAGAFDGAAGSTVERAAGAGVSWG